MKNDCSRRMSRNFCWMRISLSRSTASPIVYFLVGPGLSVTLPVGLIALMSCSPLSFENQSSTSSHGCLSKLMVTVFSGTAGGGASFLSGWVAVVGGVVCP
jgi:hypothetical protein